MKKTSTETICLLFAATFAGAALTSGCGSPTQSDALQAARIQSSPFWLEEEPDGAIGVMDARESAEDGAPLVLVGRIGGAKQPWIDGRAAFTLLDASMSVVDSPEAMGEGDVCLDGCCDTELKGCTTLVKIVDEKGELVTVDARELLGLKESDMVVVKGKAQKDKAGNFTMLANGVFVR